MLLYLSLAVLLIAIANERGLKNVGEVVIFAVILFILLMGGFQYL